MLIVKASYNGETRRYTIPSTTLPSFEQLYNQLYRVFPGGHAYYLSDVTFTADDGHAQLIASEIHSAEEYNKYVRLFNVVPWTSGKLRFNVLDESPHLKTSGMAAMPSYAPVHAQQVPESQSSTSSVVEYNPLRGVIPLRAQQGKKEVHVLLNKFLSDFGSIMSSTFGDDEPSPFVEPRAGAPSVVTPRMPGSFLQPNTPLARSSEACANGMHPEVWCDYCGHQVRGVRHKCNQCAEYDLCADCVLNHGAKEIHTSNCEQAHSFSLVLPPNADANDESASPAKPIHLGVRCDVCNNQVIGDRYKCLDCPNYDLCETCNLQVSTIHPLHEFMKFSEPGRILVHTVGGVIGKPVHNASCDLCESRIRGDRYKCTICPDFDVCEKCFVIAPEQHPTHIFAKIKEPADIMLGRIPEHRHVHSATCNVCSKIIIGYRYKCIHPTCPDFDLCMHCEALPISVHPETHPLVKIKSNSVTSVTLAHLAEQSTQTHVQQATPVVAILSPTVGEKEDSSKIAPYAKAESFATDANPEIMVERTNAVIASLPDVTLRPIYHASFLSDNNIEDGTVMAPGAEFVKSWKITNSGSVPWPAATELVFIAGDRLPAFAGAPNKYEVGVVNPGDVIDVWAADMKAPDDAGRYVSHWGLSGPDGNLFGDKMWCDIVVPELDRDGSNHSGSVVLPTPLRTNTSAPMQFSSTEMGLDTSMLAEQHGTATSHETSSNALSLRDVDMSAPSLTDDSTPSEVWEDTASVGSAYAHAPANQGLAQSLEYVVLYDSDSSHDA